MAAVPTLVRSPDGAGAPSPEPRRRRTGRRVAAGATIVAVVATVVVVRLAGRDTAPAAGPPAATTTATVQRKDLVVNDSYTGQLGYGDPTDVTANRTGIVTSVPAVGTVVGAGQALFTVDLQPTILLHGTVPAFRTLDVNADPGADVQQLEQALVDLGYGSGVTVDQTFTTGTAAAVKRWETALGRFKPDDVVTLGDVVFEPGDVRVAGVSSSVGTQVRTDSTVVTASPTAKVVTMTVNADAANRLEAGTAVHLSLPGDAETTGKITGIGPETAATNGQGAPGGQGGSTVTVTMALDDPAAARAYESGSVEVTVERSRVKDALTVPVIALLALAEGGYALQVVDGSQSSGYRLVAVTVGTFSGSDAQVTGTGIQPGVRVVVPR